jgi:hypothetical protein
MEQVRLDRQNIKMPERLQMVFIVIGVTRKNRIDRLQQTRDVQIFSPKCKTPIAQRQEPDGHMHSHIESIVNILKPELKFLSDDPCDFLALNIASTSHDQAQTQQMHAEQIKEIIRVNGAFVIFINSEIVLEYLDFL